MKSMKLKRMARMWSILGVLSLLFASPLLAENPIIQTKFTADPAPMVWNDTVFLYTSHDEDEATGSGKFIMRNWMLYTSTDMVNWQDRGTVASLADFTWGPSDNNGAWAPQVIQRNGKFYFYAPLHGKGIGVLVSDSPYGPFKDPIGKALVSADPWVDIDPTVYIDSDGQAYLYFGNPDAYYVKLNPDMISYSGGVTMIPRLTSSTNENDNYQEGPWFYKHGDYYYLAFASKCCAEGIGYAMASKPTGPWTHKGSIMDRNSLSNGNHPGIIDFNGKSYVFGFNYARTKALDPNTPRERRSICLAEMNYNPDGTIKTVPFWGSGMPSSVGVAQVGTLDPYVQIEGETMAWSEGVKTETCSEGGMNLGDIENGEYIKIKGADFGTGAKYFSARVASNTSGGNIELRLDSKTGTLIGTCAVAGTGGWQTWTTISCDVTGASEVHDLYLVFTGGSGYLFNLNWWRFVGEGGTSSPTSSSSSVPQTAYSSATIPGTVQMENYDNGGENVAYYDSESGNSGNVYREDDVDIDTADAGASYVLGWLVAGEWTEYTVEVTSAGIQPFQARVASGGDAGSFHLELDGKAITSTVIVPNTGSWTTYQTVEGETESFSAGTHVLRFVVDGSYFNMDWIHFGTAFASIHLAGSLVRTENVVYRIFDIHGTYRGRVTASSSLECSSTIRRSYPAGIYVVRAMNGNGVQKIAVVP